jgi:2-polyprenyl-3-methyl-5-hydroxy-6-metoxy-1,4-benzoquinol methylase
MNIWLQKLSDYEKENVTSLLKLSANYPPELEDIWSLMDRIWDEMGCDNQNLDMNKIKKYYQHPIWLLNGLFIENHDLSLQHRQAIACWITDKQLTRILDFGGGFGTLARMIADKNSNATINIYEPYPSQTAMTLCKNYSNIHFVDEFNSGYDCLISTDVLEHVPDPLYLFAEMISVVNIKGYLIIANHFYPSIKCHLPCTFHLRYSFDQFAQVMGLEKLGLCVGSHATIYRKINNEAFDWQAIRHLEKQSWQIFPIREFIHLYVTPWKNRIRNLILHPCRTVNKLFRIVV